MRKISSETGFTFLKSRATKDLGAVSSPDSATEFRTQRKPLFTERSKGGTTLASPYSYVPEFHDPPTIYRNLRSSSFRTHSATLPAMSYVPNGPTPRYLPTGAAAEFEKLLIGMMCFPSEGGAARY